jgi:hypothetical protein
MDEQPQVNREFEQTARAHVASHTRRMTRTKQGKLMLAVASAVVLLVGGWLISAGQERIPSLREMGLALAEPELRPLSDASSWQPGAKDGEGYAVAIDNGKYALSIHSITSAIKLLNYETGYVWRSNPPQEKLESETVKGTLLANLKSPFMLEYHEEGKSQRLIVNNADKDLAIDYQLDDERLQVNYWFNKQAIGFSLQYRLTASGMEVRVPDASIREEGANFIVSLQVLPFFGATRNEEQEGYLFVPDGPGGLIYFDADRTIAGRGYRYNAYGEDWTIRAASTENVRESLVTYPVFGIKHRDEAFVAVLKDGRFESRIKGQPAGIVSSYNTAVAEWIYREEYGQKLSKLTPPINTIQKERISGDRVIEYRLLDGKGAGYVQMAHSYREYLQEAGELPDQEAITEQLSASIGPSSEMPLLLTIVGGSTGESPVGDKYETATTFGQAEQIIEQLEAEGIDNIEVILKGWQQGGEPGVADIFPVERKLGGTAGAQKFIDMAHSFGYKVLFDQNFIWYSDKASGISARTDGIRAMDGTVFTYSGMFVMTPSQSVGLAYEAINRLEKLGADGIAFSEFGKRIYSDRQSDRVVTREQTAHLFGAAMNYARERLGKAVAETGSDYILSHTELIQELPFETSYDLNVDETVPFYPIVLHGLIPYSFTPGNMRARYDDHFLKAIEYGAIPSFVVTHEPSISIRFTLDNDLYSTHFAKWKDRIVEEYRAFSQLAPLQGKTIVSHRRLEDGVYETEYEGGARVIVDYNASTFQVIEGD